MTDLKQVEYYLHEYSLAETRLNSLRGELRNMVQAVEEAEMIIEHIDSEEVAELLSIKVRRILDAFLGEIDTVTERCEEIIEMINSLVDPEMRAVFEFSYYKQMTFSRIATELYISKTKVQDLHRTGLAIIDSQYDITGRRG